jgi:RimJ/RimL family protein N-acetyltransferase
MFNAFSLESDRLWLMPLEINHLPQYEKIFSPDFFSQMKSQYNTAAEFIEDKLTLYRLGILVPFAILSKHDDSLIGFTSLASISIKNKNVEMSGTWIDKKEQKKGYNTEIKFTLMKYLFETLNFSRVNFTAQTNNVPSLNTLESLGLKKVGLIKDWIIVSGKSQDGIMFVATFDDWKNIQYNYRNKKF